MVEQSFYVVRHAVPTDVPTIFSLIQALAVYENLSHEVVGSEASLHGHMFGDRPYVETILVEVDSKPAGFALFFRNYSTEVGTLGYYLEDLFVFPEFRGQGLGKALLSALAKRTLAQNFQHLQWSVLDWNAPAIAFYKKIGAKVHEHQRIARITGDALVPSAELLSSESDEVFSATLVDANFLRNHLDEISTLQDTFLTQTKTNPTSLAVRPIAQLIDAVSAHPPAVEVLAIQQQEELMGLATFTHSYSTFLTQPGLLVEAMVTVPGDRALDIRTSMLHALISLAAERQCGRLEWIVSQNNDRAISQCIQMRANVLPDWRVCRMNAEAIANLASAQAV